MSLVNTTIATPEAMGELCRNFYAEYLSEGPGGILLLEGDLGAGKTTFCHGFNQALGITDTINSPTFNLLNEYRGERGLLYHYDLYRMADPEEVVEAGFSELWEAVYALDVGDPTKAGRGAGGAGRAIHAVEWWRRAGDYMPVGIHTYRVRIAWEQGADNKGGSLDTEEELRRVVIDRLESWADLDNDDE